MATLQEHADKIKQAMADAEADGFTISFEWEHDPYDSTVLDSLSLDLNEYSKLPALTPTGKERSAIKDWVVLREETF